MNIVIDCFKLVKGSGKSIGIYNVALNIVRNLINVPNCDFRYIILGNKFNRDDFDIEGVTFVEVNKNPANKLYCVYWELFEVVRWYGKVNGDLILFPRGYTTLFHRLNDAIIVHDLIPFYYKNNYPDYFNKYENFYIMKRLAKSIANANAVITISEFSKQEIVRTIGVSESKISVIYNGLNKVSSVTIDADINIPDEIEDGYIVAVTSGLPHKNAKGIIKSYEQYCTKVEHPLRLIVIGISDVDKCGIEEKVKERITCYKYIESDEELHSIIKGATFMMFLSEVEGFGFPPIEAMQLSVPVLCSNASSLPEVTGDAAILVSPHDYDDVSDKMILLQSDASLRKELVEKGHNNTNRFKWNVVAEKYISIFDNMLE